MIQFGQGKNPFYIAGKGEALRPEPGLFDARLKSVVRYADPSAWTCAAAVAHAVSARQATLAADRDAVGVIVVGDEGPQEAMQSLDDAAATGFSSPLKFPAGNPGSLVGVTCILLGFRGPTHNLTMPPAAGVPVGLVLAAGWLARRVCSSVLITSCTRQQAEAPRARSLLLITASDALHADSLWSESDLAWLSFVSA
jgi:hypothetical protein